VRSRMMAFDSPCRGAGEGVILDLESVRCVNGLPQRSARAAGGAPDGIPSDPG